GGPDRLPAGKPRHDRGRNLARQGDVARGRARDHCPAILSLFGHRRTCAAWRGRDQGDGGRIRQLWRAGSAVQVREEDRVSVMSTYQVDLLVVGGGINGVGIARDAAGRGLSVLLCEKDDLAQGTSSRSGKLVHGGLRY